MERTPTPVTAKEAKELIDLINEATLNFRGNLNHLHTAIGVLLVGRELGWKPLLLIHDKKTIRRCEEILGVEFRKVLPEVGNNADKSIAWKLAQKVTSFWKAVRGEIKGVRSPEID
ncbi:hypothetical protein D8Y20_07815 [Mariprofundus sp. EBB-1]|uniref:hypothetical protein n=1 Tax=Mariprofundus sp. EBB-1 TaxID=2650971 RepID=UPI000EF20BE1|nr:hypothetical protein [Mariprofundus sp. EBB-1]RLL52179.1 hypothetical protein D8Y20_07815 [Mariprofundus sp. EBB-1]